MTQHPILLGAVKTYKMTLFNPWNGYGKLATTECLCYFFFVEYFLSVSILYKIPGSSFCKHWMHSTSSLPTAVSCAQITNTEGRTCLSAARTSAVAPTKTILTRNTASIRNEYLLSPWCLGISFLPKTSKPIFC